MLQVLNRMGPSIKSLGIVAQNVGEHTKSTGNDWPSMLRKLYLGAGLNDIFQINDCETDGDFTESDDSTFDIAAAAATGKRVGTNCMKLSSTAACDGTQYVQSLLINESKKPFRGADGRRQMNWEDTRYLGFWVHNEVGGDFSTAGELKATIVVDGVEQTQVNVQALVDSVHQWFEIDMVANSWDRNLVESIRFYANVGIGEDIYIDDIVRYEISYDRGPLYGCMFPIKSGTALSDGDTVKWTADGLIKTTSAVVADLGTVKLFKNGAPVASATGDGGRSVWGIIPGVCIFITRANATTQAGEGLEWAANGLVAGVATGVDELGFAKGFEAAGAQYDDIFATKTFGGNFIA